MEMSRAEQKETKKNIAYIYVDLSDSWFTRSHSKKGIDLTIDQPSCLYNRVPCIHHPCHSSRSFLFQTILVACWNVYRITPASEHESICR